MAALPRWVQTLQALDARAYGLARDGVSALLRAVAPETFHYGADFASAYVSAAGYDVAQAMAAYAAFPWVVACLEAKSTDLAGLPLRLRKGRGASSTVIDEHETLDLFETPSRRISGVLFRRQAVIDLELSGNWYALPLVSGRKVTALLRLHPERVRIVPDPVDGIGAYEYDHQGGTTRYSPDDVLHVRLPSFESGPEGLYGQGKIRALHQDLTTDIRTQVLASTRAKQGRPDVILSPTEDAVVWKDDVRKSIKAAYDRMLHEGGAMVVSSGVKVDLPAWTPRDLEFEKVRTMARDATLAAFGVPGTRVGLPNANYATAVNDSAIYWQNLVGLAALFDEQFTRVASRTDRTHRLYHDFSRIDALQASRDARLQRVLTWNLLGASPADAAAYEGFDDAPVSAAIEDVSEVAPETVPSTAPTIDLPSLLEIVASVAAGNLSEEGAIALMEVAFPGIDKDTARRIVEGAIALPEVSDPVAAKDLRARWLGGVLRRQEPASAISRVFFPVAGSSALKAEVDRASWAVKLDAIPATEPERAALSHAFVERLYEPQARRVALATTRFLSAQGKRLAAKLEGRTVPKGVVRGVEEDLFLSIFDEEAEAEAMDAALRSILRKAIGDAFRSSTAQMDLPLNFDPHRWDLATGRQVGSLVVDVGDYTRKRIREVLVNRIAAGSTIGEMQTALMADHAFSASRALRIARTETTRSVNAGSLEAYKAAEDVGVVVRKQWLSARDGAVRDDHRLLDGQTVDRAGKFEIGGDTADAPGGFRDPGLSVNCRCTVIPVIGE